MKPNAWKTISHTNMSRAIPYRVLATTTAVTCALLVTAYSANAATIDRTLCLKEVKDKPMSGGPVTFWGYTPVPAPTTAKPTPTCADAGVGQIPAPPVEVGIGDTLNLTLTLMGGMGAMPPMEGMMGSKYFGHTIHLHGADVPSLEDGVPETNGNTVTGDTYTWIPTAEMAGTYMYHCHVHTVKHLEMGMYGPLIVRPVNSNSTGPTDRYLDQLTPDPATAYNFIQTYLFSTVDPAYHTATATGDSPVFADYNPTYFLINGKESIAKDSTTGALKSVEAETLTATQNSKVALRLIGLHSVKGTFSIRDSRDTTGAAKPFTVYVEDGRQYPTPEKNVTTLDIGPGQRFDIIFDTPSTPGTWYPQFEYQKLRDASPGGAKIPYATVYGQVTF